ncbi:hypothetical protein EVAR_36307_1 [Eumeta japonica]|uniref:Uncharacterized protein n=1 Tax=Eumeta variegata TaxID=151549 RepID=A0A4C1VKV4_EUMVA|nr:hypothetical protein EVAR_36307_1 [Eumeta japonica]
MVNVKFRRYRTLNSETNRKRNQIGSTRCNFKDIEFKAQSGANEQASHGRRSPSLMNIGNAGGVIAISITPRRLYTHLHFTSPVLSRVPERFICEETNRKREQVMATHKYWASCSLAAGVGAARGASGLSLYENPCAIKGCIVIAGHRPRNPRGVISAVLVSWERIGYLMEEDWNGEAVGHRNSHSLDETQQ